MLGHDWAIQAPLVTKSLVDGEPACRRDRETARFVTCGNDQKVPLNCQNRQPRVTSAYPCLPGSCVRSVSDSRRIDPDVTRAWG